VYLLQAQPTSFDTLGGLVWLAVLVTLGVRSNTAAALAGISFAVVPAIFQTYLPLSVAEVPTAVFGLGAILLARNTDGVVSMHARQLRGAITGISRVALSAVSGRVRAES
jgi:branched-chain amino acid transport system permease protein